jgi:hypothetical protein
LPPKLSPEEKKRRQKARATAWRKANHAREREINLAWRLRNPEKLKAAKREYRATPEGRARGLCDNARRRAEKKGIPFSLSAKWVSEALGRGYCEATGIPFNMQSGEGRSPFAPSIDRIDCSKGYTEENARVVVWAFNMACGEFGEEVLWQIVKARWPERLQEGPMNETQNNFTNAVSRC